MQRFFGTVTRGEQTGFMDRKKVAIMTRMAFYQQGKGKEDLKVTQYYKKDYASLHMWFSLIWMTIGYALVIGALFFSFSDRIFTHTHLKYYIRLGMAIVVVYLILLLVYGIASHTYYSDKHKASRKRVKRFMRDVVRLEKMYGRDAEQ